MTKSMRNARARARRGVTALELAISAMMLCTLTLGIIEFSRLGMVAQLATNTAREGCRVAVLQSTAAADVQARVNALLTPVGITPRTLTPVNADPGTAGLFIMPSNWESAAGDTPITVTLRVNFNDVAWSAPLFLKTATVVGTATLNSERP